MNRCIHHLSKLPAPGAALIGLLLCGVAPADDASVLPAGASRFNLDFYHYHPTTRRYNAAGEREPLAFPFDDAVLDENVFPALAPLGPGAVLGDVMVEFEYRIDVLDLGYAYGVDDRLSIGFHLPYYRIENRVDTRFDSASATVGLAPGGVCCLPLGGGGTPMAEDDVQNLIADSFGFARVEDWRREGVGDLELGAKYRLFGERDSAFALTGGLRVPSGYEDDADELTDVAWSYGNYALLLRLHYDRLLSNRWQELPSSLARATPAAGDLILNLTLRYDLMLPDDRIMRVGDTPDQVFTNNRERVDRELGDIYNLELSLRYHAKPALSLFATWTLTWKDRDRISGDLGYNYASLEADTDSRHQIVIVGFNYSTLPAYLEQRAAVPLEWSLAYRERFDGEGPRIGQANTILYTRWIVAGLKLYF